MMIRDEVYKKPVKEVPQTPNLSYTNEDATFSAKTELYIKGSGTPMRRTDYMIAALTINSGASLYTLDFNTSNPLQPSVSNPFPKRQACSGVANQGVNVWNIRCLDWGENLNFSSSQTSLYVSENLWSLGRLG